MDALAAGLVALINGLISLFSALASPVILALIMGGCACVWLALMEIEELDRQSNKPDVVQH